MASRPAASLTLWIAPSKARGASSSETWFTMGLLSRIEMSSGHVGQFVERLGELIGSTSSSNLRKVSGGNLNC